GSNSLARLRTGGLVGMPTGAGAPGCCAKPDAGTTIETRVRYALTAQRDRWTMRRSFCVMSGAGQGTALRASWPRESNAESHGVEAAATPGANVVPTQIRPERTIAIASMRQVRWRLRGLSTFMLEPRRCRGGTPPTGIVRRVQAPRRFRLFLQI